MQFSRAAGSKKAVRSRVSLPGRPCRSCDHSASLATPRLSKTRVMPASARNPATAFSRHPTSAFSRHSTNACPRHPTSACPRNPANAFSRHPTNSSARHPTNACPRHACPRHTCLARAWFGLAGGCGAQDRAAARSLRLWPRLTMLKPPWIAATVRVERQVRHCRVLMRMAEFLTMTVSDERQLSQMT